ncbi:hypothetical protein J6590_078388 [Homalodisca vitripennis]|nr:hypothetical protein J6590_078388 [Homalodisca vitripennis]
MNSPCNKICRDCGENYHSEDFYKPKKCVHCYASHSSNSRQCPKYLSILREMADLEDNTSYRSSPEYSGPKQVTGTGSFKSTKVNTNGTSAYKQLQGKFSNSRNRQALTPSSSNRDLAPRINMQEQTKQCVKKYLKSGRKFEIKTKGQIDEALMSFLSDDVASKTKIKSNTPIDKQGKPHNPSSVITKSSTT